MSGKIIAFTQTHNSKRTISRCIESILGQTYRNIVYYIVDNASTDGTIDIIKRHSQNDTRLKLIISVDNVRWQIFSWLSSINKEFCDEDSFIVLDSDDEYDPRCFEKLLSFKQSNNLDIASCMSSYIDGLTGKVVSKLATQDELIISERLFESMFAEYFRFARDSWGKLFSFSLLRNCVINSFDDTILNGSASVLVFELLKYANRFGVMPERLHHYYIYPDSFERHITSEMPRIATPMVFETFRKFLIIKCGSVSERNEVFLYKNYYAAIKNRIDAVIHSELTIIECTRLFRIIAFAEFTREMLQSKNVSGVDLAEKICLLNTIIEWAGSQPKCDDAQCLFTDIQLMKEELIRRE
jgi:glycosyltransferase involved in cell wall biosynthesis